MTPAVSASRYTALTPQGTEGYEGKILGLSRDEFLLKIREHINNMTDEEWKESIERAKAAALADAEYFGEDYETNC